ncbi:VanZ family protein [Paenibacillus sp. LMG 31456]|uniref:VanZ family protein n=1 Tax=Paenibacillus foliorum TaxID=2654974 RepID=A0A972GQR8_9BACL|nr:VanZ family protein [Paenibacillus foliorum]NOU95119.1 VanZ family protein [Paenibacillus foliorum]
MRKGSVYWILVLFWCVVIFSVTSSPGATSENTGLVIKAETNVTSNVVSKINFGIRKTAHVTLFGVLAILLLLAIGERNNAPLKAWFLATIYGATDEFHQIFEPGRTPALQDVGIDSFGAVIALIAFCLLRRLLSKRVALKFRDQ